MDHLACGEAAIHYHLNILSLINHWTKIYRLKPTGTNICSIHLQRTPDEAVKVAATYQQSHKLDKNNFPEFVWMVWLKSRKTLELEP